MNNRRKFIREYKVEAVRLAEQRGFSEAASSLGVYESSLYQ
jgi:transposase-like protein